MSAVTVEERVVSATELPMRPLGRTGWNATILGLGGVCYNTLPEKEAYEIVNRAIDLGINYIDTAHGYEGSEVRIGPVMAKRRSEVFLATKTAKRKRDEAKAEIEESFQRLRTDTLDLLQIHCVENHQQLDEALSEDGAIRAVEEFQRKGKIKFIGITGHTDPHVIADALRRYRFDTVLIPVGALSTIYRKFLPIVLPVARERGTAIVAMKVFAHGKSRCDREMLLRYALGQPVSVAIVGVDNTEQVEANVRFAKSFTPLTEEERENLYREVREQGITEDFGWVKSLYTKET